MPVFHALFLDDLGCSFARSILHVLSAYKEGPKVVNWCFAVGYLGMWVFVNFFKTEVFLTQQNLCQTRIRLAKESDQLYLDISCVKNGLWCTPAGAMQG